MTRRFFYIVLGLVLLIIFVIARMPLGFLMQQMNPQAAGLNYSSAEGTIWKGRLNGLEVAGQPIGDVTLVAQPLDLLNGGLGYRVQWGGPGGAGAGNIFVGPSRATLSDISLQQSLGSLEGLTNEVRAFGGTIRLRDGGVTLTDSACTQASGQIASDVLTNIGEAYGRAFGPISGQIECDNGALLISLLSTSETGDKVDIWSRLSIGGRAEVMVEVVTNDIELGATLAELNFERYEGLWRYSRIEGMGE